jgi:hypothetical protein
MHFHFLLSGPQGDIEFSAEFLEQPFLLSPTEKHPFLSLGDYFKAIQKMLLQDNGRALNTALAADLKYQEDPADISAQ